VYTKPSFAVGSSKPSELVPTGKATTSEGGSSSLALAMFAEGAIHIIAKLTHIITTVATKQSNHLFTLVILVILLLF
jgi:hypothetical protein